MPVARICPSQWLSTAAGARTVTTRSFTGAGRPKLGWSTLDWPGTPIRLSVKSDTPLDKRMPAVDSSSILFVERSNHDAAGLDRSTATGGAMAANVTIATVARLANVSRQTVSNVLNSPDLVRAETRDRVRA